MRDANLAIKYLLQFEGVLSDPGIETSEEIEEIVNIVDGSWELTPQDRQKMDEIRAELGARFCQWCGYCMPCPQDVEISWLMNTSSLWKLWPLQRFFPRMSEAVESGRECIQCGECEEKCPYHLPIREMIEENIAFYERVATEYHTQ